MHMSQWRNVKLRMESWRGKEESGEARSPTMQSRKRVHWREKASSTDSTDMRDYKQQVHSTTIDRLRASECKAGDGKTQNEGKCKKKKNERNS